MLQLFIYAFFGNFNSHAHVERDGLKLDNINKKKNFNSHAHVERDCTIFWTYKDLVISTHTLTWSVTMTPCVII